MEWWDSWGAGSNESSRLQTCPALPCAAQRDAPLFVQPPLTTLPSPAPHKPLECRTFASERSNKDLNQILSQHCICLEASALAARLGGEKKSFLAKTTPQGSHIWWWNAVKGQDHPYTQDNDLPRTKVWEAELFKNWRLPWISAEVGGVSLLIVEAVKAGLGCACIRLIQQKLSLLGLVNDLISVERLTHCVMTHQITPPGLR